MTAEGNHAPVKVYPFWFWSGSSHGQFARGGMLRVVICTVTVWVCPAAVGSGYWNDMEEFVEETVTVLPTASVMVFDGKLNTMKWLTVSVSDRKSTRLNSSHRCISYAVF